MSLASRALRAWWAWSTTKGIRRKLIGFGVPLLLIIAIATALTPDRPEDTSRDDIFEPPVEATATPEPSATTRAEASATDNAVGTLPPDVGQPDSSPEAPSASEAPDPLGRRRAIVAEVIDGDTVILSDGRRLRYIGIDTAETVAPGEPVQCFGPEATARNEELVLGQSVLLETDVSETDRFDRLLRYVYLEDGRMVNEVLVEEGYAESVAYEPDTRYQARLDAAEERARSANLGRWVACATGPAATATATTAPTAAPDVLGECPLGCETPPPGCLIKGNISDERIYHVPGQQHYERTVIRPEDGERWFCTEQEALANGWRKALR